MTKVEEMRETADLFKKLAESFEGIFNAAMNEAYEQGVKDTEARLVRDQMREQEDG